MSQGKNWQEPFRPGNAPIEPSPQGPGIDPDIQHEPHQRSTEFLPDKSEQTAGQELDPLGAPPTLHERVEHSVWEEPALSADLAVPPSDALTYASWLAQCQAETALSTSWRTCLVIAVISGPLAILGTLITQADRGTQLMMVCFIGPLTEEVMKAAGLLWVTEKRPFLFTSRSQILTCALCSGLAFAAIENVLYLQFYIPAPSAGLVVWRWTACVALHAGCTCVSGLGLVATWQRSMSQRTRPQLSRAAPYIVAAVVLHAVYNLLAILVVPFL